jgi:hypothetical protein
MNISLPLSQKDGVLKSRPLVVDPLSRREAGQGYPGLLALLLSLWNFLQTGGV